MILNSFDFLIVLPLVLCLYVAVIYLCRNNRYSNIVSAALLTSISYGFFLFYQPLGAMILFAVTAITYLFALVMERHRDRKRLQKTMLITTFVIIAIAPLAVLKYSSFVTGLFTDIFNNAADANASDNTFLDNLFLPLGISFFTFQSVGYLWDVYRHKINAEHNFLYYMLFVGFFPQIASGPISKADELLPQIKGRRAIAYTDLTEGARLMLWGYFLKAVVADRLATFVDPVYADYMNFSGVTCFIASVFYSLQIYGDFAGYSLIAIGVGRLFGFDLINNFRRPYLSQSITEFWKKWHISLTRWLTDYVYIPLGGNRKGKPRTYANIMATFMVSGIWHGANMTFIVWGLLHGLVQCLERLLGIGKKSAGRVMAFFRIILTFLIADFAWILFRMPTLSDAGGLMKRIITFAPGAALSLSKTELSLIAFALAFLLVAEIIQEYYPSRILLRDKRRFVRSLSFIMLLFIILTMGVLDSSQFIYVKF